MPRTRIGTNIKLLRKSWGQTQKELGRALGVESNTISMYESGARTPDATVLNSKTRFVKVPFCKSYKLFNKICMRETGDALDALCKYRKRRQEHTFLPPRFLLPLLFSG